MAMIATNPNKLKTFSFKQYVANDASKIFINSLLSYIDYSIFDYSRIKEIYTGHIRENISVCRNA